MIDIIIPAYNCCKTLGRTLASLVAQTDTEFKVVIVDDCSTENINPIIDEYRDKLNIRYIRNQKNLGVGMTRQVGIDNSTQPFFCFLDSDDILLPYAVETFNSAIKTDPGIELIHSYFYEQTMVHGNPALILRKDGFMWCHGKLYSREAVNRYGIKNSPDIRWADDSYFNSMCSELLNTYLVRIPMYLWCNNSDSVIRRKDPERDKLVRIDFLNAMNMSVEFVLRHKNSVEHLDATIKNIYKNDRIDLYSAEEKAMLERLSKHTKEE